MTKNYLNNEGMHWYHFFEYCYLLFSTHRYRVLRNAFPQMLLKQHSSTCFSTTGVTVRSFTAVNKTYNLQTNIHIHTFTSTSTVLNPGIGTDTEVEPRYCCWYVSLLTSPIPMFAQNHWCFSGLRLPTTDKNRWCKDCRSSFGCCVVFFWKLQSKV